MSVRVTLLGGLGNNLFQYALGRIIAEHHGFALFCGDFPDQAPIPLWDAAKIPCSTLTELAAYFPNAPLHIPGRRYEQPLELYEVGRGKPWRGHTIDLAAILSNPRPRQIRLAGFFQRFEYFAPYRAHIKEWFALRPIEHPYQVGPRDVLVSIRRGPDYGIQNWSLLPRFYDEILSQLRGIGRVYLCGTGIDDQIRRSLMRYDPIIYDASPIEHFAFITCFHRIVLSNSTFAWWASFLSNAEEIYAPRAPASDTYGFTGYKDVELHMREARYREICPPGVAKFFLFTLRKDVASSISTDGRSLFVQPCGEPEVLLPLSHGEGEFLVWLLQQPGPLAWTDIPARFRGANCPAFLLQLADAGVLSINGHYLE
jgi:hypothetical protein